jgi:DNA replication protein DnaC
MTTEQLKNTWFYETRLKNNEDLQKAFLDETQTNFSLESQIFYGNVGTGKTYNSIKLAQKYCSQAHEDNDEYWHYSLEPDFITQEEFQQILKDREFGSDELKVRAFYRMQEIEETPFLVFDDIRCVRLSDYHKNQLDNAYLDFFGRRYSNRKKQITIITTNNTIEQFYEFFSEAVCDRIFGTCKTKNQIEGDSKR